MGGCAMRGEPWSRIVIPGSIARSKRRMINRRIDAVSYWV